MARSSRYSGKRSSTWAQNAGEWSAWIRWHSPWTNAYSNADGLHSVRFMLDLGENRIVEIAQLSDAGFKLDKAEVQACMKKRGEAGFVECPGLVLSHFQDGLVIHYRSPGSEANKLSVDKRVSSRMVFKRRRVAFEFKDADRHPVLEATGFRLSKPEL